LNGVLLHFDHLSLAHAQPTIKRLLAFSAMAASQKLLDADVFIQVGPLNGVPIPQQLPILPFRVLGEQEPWIPRQGYDQAPSIGQIDNQVVSRYFNFHCRRFDLKHQSIYAMPPEGLIRSTSR
jgi:hypothetical protein